MVTLEQVAQLCEALPEVTVGTSYGRRAWFVGTKHFAWERPFSKADLARFGDRTPPDGPILALRVDDLVEKDAVLGARHRGFFTIPHFDGYAAVLVQLRVAAPGVVSDAVEDAWLAVAPPRVAEAHLARRRRRP